jgi:predicted helicase
VWLWQDWPDRDGKPDTGIGLVARKRHRGGWCAIQVALKILRYSFQAR